MPDPFTVRCRNCQDTGHVCENHPQLPWEPVAGRGCGCGPGRPCGACCSPIPEGGTQPIGLAFTPDHRRQVGGGDANG